MIFQYRSSRKFEKFYTMYFERYSILNVSLPMLKEISNFQEFVLVMFMVSNKRKERAFLLGRR